MFSVMTVKQISNLNLLQHLNKWVKPKKAAAIEHTTDVIHNFINEIHDTYNHKASLNKAGKVYEWKPKEKTGEEDLIKPSEMEEFEEMAQASWVLDEMEDVDESMRTGFDSLVLEGGLSSAIQWSKKHRKASKSKKKKKKKKRKKETDYNFDSDQEITIKKSKAEIRAEEMAKQAPWR